MEKISIIMPVYNVESYVSKSLDSLIKQSYKNIEVLVCDDGSLDNSGNICDEYALKDNRIKVFHIKHSGISCARNLCLDNVTGDYIGFLDADDLFEEDTLEKLMNNMNKENADISICASDYVYPNKKKLYWKKNKYMVMNNEEAIRYMCTDKYYSVGCCNKLYKKFIFDNIRFPNNKISEDGYIEHLLLENASKVVYESFVGHHYIQREGSVTHQEGINEERVKSSFKCYRYIEKNFPDISKYAYNAYLLNCLSYYSKYHTKELENYLIENKKKMCYKDLPFNRKVEVSTFFLSRKLFVAFSKLFFSIRKIFYY